MSADGRFVAFSSDVDSISSEDNDQYRNVFVRELGAPAPAAATCTSATATADADSWVGQDAPAATHGADPSLVVRSKRRPTGGRWCTSRCPPSRPAAGSPTRSCG